MKKILVVAAMFVALVNTNVFAAKKAKQAKMKIEIMNRPGMALGTEIPKWVEAVLEGDNKTIAKSLKIDLKEYQIFVFSNQGTDLEFLKTWTDQVDVQRQVANSFSMAVGQSANAVYRVLPEMKIKRRWLLTRQSRHFLQWKLMDFLRNLRIGFNSENQSRV